MGNSSSTNKVTAQDKAILDLKIQRDKLHQYQKRITVLTNREHEIAKQHLQTNDRPRALLALRRKKYQETLLSRTDQQLAQLEILTADVEFALVQKDVLFGLQQGTAVLKEIQKEMGGVEQVEKLIGEGEEQKAYQKEISEMLEGRMSATEEDEVEDELRALEAEQRERTGASNLPTAPEGEVLPAAPKDELIQTETTKTSNGVEERQAIPA
ncbi:hypothetical protein FH972_022092 [Carpinus fangiana]|uniref:Uncharacterized protein n=1 Tax=Carpinus fangiana TaxID=176857 RepID=A0A5N6KR80_9ROSI|nr:hypothetical protein FH972_022092 [Carpinus fangiana]